VTAGLGPPLEHVLISLPALNRLRVSEATAAGIAHPGPDRVHRTQVLQDQGIFGRDEIAERHLVKRELQKNVRTQLL
jgi:hypothetical protein